MQAFGIIKVQPKKIKKIKKVEIVEEEVQPSIKITQPKVHQNKTVYKAAQQSYHVIDHRKKKAPLNHTIYRTRNKIKSEVMEEVSQHEHLQESKFEEDHVEQQAKEQSQKSENCESSVREYKQQLETLQIEQEQVQLTSRTRQARKYQASSYYTPIKPEQPQLPPQTLTPLSSQLEEVQILNNEQYRSRRQYHEPTKPRREQVSLSSSDISNASELDDIYLQISLQKFTPIYF